jgi:flavin reductase (DIM6/NTAB) family NADH-FMN oxidoreductase RutF
MTSDIAEATFRLGMSRLAGAVSIVATGSIANPASWRGMTATAVCSLCAEPPSLVVCLNRVTGTFHQLRQDGLFSVNVLASRHVRLAHTFAGYDGLAGADRFTAEDWIEGTLAVPVLADALASFECCVSQSIDYGTHSLLIGGIVTARWTEDQAEPLVYHRHRFRELGHAIEMTEGPAA